MALQGENPKRGFSGTTSESLLDVLEQLSAHYERSMQMLTGE